MLFRSRLVSPSAFERASGWALLPEGLCSAGRCVPLAREAVDGNGRLDVVAAAERLRRPVVADQARGLWCLGPEADQPVLGSIDTSDLALPDLDGQPFVLRSLRGQKVLLVAWASW